MEGFFVRSLLRDAVLVKPKSLGGNFSAGIKQALQEQFEGVCSRHGYIRRGSIALHHIFYGNVQASSLNGDVRFDVQYYAGVCNPPVGVVIRARVVNMNKFGVLAHGGLLGADGVFVPVVEGIIMRNLSSDADTAEEGGGQLEEGVAVGDEVFMEILGKKFELNDSKISVIGRLVDPKDDAKVRARTSGTGGGIIGDLRLHSADKPFYDYDKAAADADDDQDIEVHTSDSEGDSDDNSDSSSDSNSDSDTDTKDGDVDEDDADVDVDADADADADDNRPKRKPKRGGNREKKQELVEGSDAEEDDDDDGDGPVTRAKQATLLHGGSDEDEDHGPADLDSDVDVDDNDNDIDDGDDDYP